MTSKPIQATLFKLDEPKMPKHVRCRKCGSVMPLAECYSYDMTLEDDEDDNRPLLHSLACYFCKEKIPANTEKYAFPDERYLQTIHKENSNV